MTEKRKRNVKGKVECDQCGRKLMNEGALRGHRAYCKGARSEAPPGGADAEAKGAEGPGRSEAPRPRRSTPPNNPAPKASLGVFDLL